MESIGSKNIFLEGPVLVNLRRQFHEITFDCCSAYCLVSTLAQKAVKGVSELVEGSLDLVDAQKGCLFL